MRSALASTLLLVAISLAGAQAEASADASKAKSESSGSAATSTWGADWGNPSAWRTSLALGIGVASRGVDGTVSTQNLKIAGPFSSGQFVRNDLDDRSLAIDGIWIPLEARLMLPAFEGLPADPGFFFEGGYAFDLYKDKSAGLTGYELPDFATPGALPYLADQTIEQEQRWYAGVGMSFRLPIEMYAVRLGASLRYYEDKTILERRLIISTATPILPPNYEYVHQTNLIVRELAPGLVLDVDLDKRGPILIGIYVDARVAIALENPDNTLVVPGPFNPNPGTATYEYSSSDIRYEGSVGFRLTWAGL
jgi:hypothetical protein